MIPCKNIKFVKTLTKSKENEKSTLGFEETLKSLNKGKSKDQLLTIYSKKLILLSKR